MCIPASAITAFRCANSMATFVHPNELFDGAITVDTTRSGRGYYPTTWDWQNHPLVLELYAEHGRSLNFGGVILQRIRFETNHGKEVGAQNAARLAKAMGADGALVTWIGGGNAFVDVMFTVRACEQSGIKTTLVTYENGGKEGKDSPVLFYLAEADAVVSTGSSINPWSCRRWTNRSVRTKKSRFCRFPAPRRCPSAVRCRWNPAT